MLFHRAGQVAMQAALVLALEAPATPRRARELGLRLSVPPTYLVKVLHELARAGVTYQSRKADPDPARSRRMGRARWVIETAFGQLAERFHLKRTWARDVWHLSHRVIRKVLSHTVAVWLYLTTGRRALDFDELVYV